ncbi:unnamed protein product, partial [Closterium sp. NIES-53]
CVVLHVYTDGSSPDLVNSSARVESVHTGYQASSAHPSLPRLRGMHSRLLVSGLPRSLPPLPPSPAPPCLPCVEGRQRAAPHSSSFPSMTASLLTLHMDVWGPARVSGQCRERYFLLVVDDYTRYTTVFPLRSNGQVVDVLIPWIRKIRLQLRERFSMDLPVLCLHSDRGGEFSSDLLRDFCRGEGILQSFTLPASPQRSGIAERRIGLVMEVARTSMIHAAAPHFLWTFAVRYAVHQLNLRPRVSLPETSPTLRWTGQVGEHRCSGSGALVPLFAIRPWTSSPPVLSPASSLDFPLTHLAGSFTTPPRTVSSPLRTSLLTNPLLGTVPVEIAGGSGALELEALAREALALEELELLTLVHRLTNRSRLYSQPPHCLLLLLTLRSPAVLQSVVSLRLILSRMFALLVAFVTRVLLLSSACTLWHFVLPLFHCVFLYRLLVSPLFLPSLAVSLTALALATAVTDPSFDSAAASTLVAELLEFAAASRLDYATALFAEAESAGPPSIRGECALGTDVLEDRQEDFECLATAVPRFASMLLALEGDPDAPDIPTPRSYAEAITGAYVDEVPPPGANIVDGMWIFRGADYFQTFSPTPKITTLRVLLHVAAQRDYDLHSLAFSTAFLQGSLHEEIRLRCPPGFTGSFPTGTKWSLWRPVYSLRKAPCKWHDTLRTALAALGFAPSNADLLLFLRTDTSLPPFNFLIYVDDLVFATADMEALTLVLQRFCFLFSSPQPTPLSTSHSLSASPSDESVEPSGPYLELVGILMYLMTCTRPFGSLRGSRTSGMGLVLGGWGPVVLTGHAVASWVEDSATQRSSQGYTFSLGSGSVSWRSTRSSSVLTSSFEAEIYAGAMVAQELRWLTYVLTDLG